MNQRHIGIILIIIGILFIGFVFVLKVQLDASADAQAMAAIESTGTCITEEGLCLHKQYTGYYVVGWIFSAAILLLGIYLVFFDRTQALLAQQNVRVAKALRDAKHQDTAKEKFNSFLAGFSDEEQLILKSVHEQDGIKQSTLRFRTGMSKASLSLMLASLEKREIISRKESGKTKEVYLRKKF